MKDLGKESRVLFLISEEQFYRDKRKGNFWRLNRNRKRALEPCDLRSKIMKVNWMNQKTRSLGRIVKRISLHLMMDINDDFVLVIFLGRLYCGYFFLVSFQQRF
jgi:hypothetical protein